LFTRPAGNSIADQTIKSNEAFDVVIQAEAGETLHNLGGPYKLSLIVRDLSNNGNNVNQNSQTGNFGDANWPNLDMEYSFNVPAQGNAKKDHIYQAIVVLTAGNVNPIVGFAESDLFVITKP
jgi:hypothetical protein